MAMYIVQINDRPIVACTRREDAETLTKSICGCTGRGNASFIEVPQVVCCGYVTGGYRDDDAE